jgi:hypothetical protein
MGGQFIISNLYHKLKIPQILQEPMIIVHPSMRMTPYLIDGFVYLVHTYLQQIWKFHNLIM